jgi:hypothetical protein
MAVEALTMPFVCSLFGSTQRFLMPKRRNSARGTALTYPVQYRPHFEELVKGLLVDTGIFPHCFLPALAPYTVLAWREG